MEYDDTEMMETARERLDETSYGLIRVLHDLCDTYGYRGVLRTLEDMLEAGEVDTPPYTHVFRDEWHQPIGTIDKIEETADGVVVTSTLSDFGRKFMEEWDKGYFSAGEKSGEEESPVDLSGDMRGWVPESQEVVVDPPQLNVDLSELKKVLDGLDPVDERDPSCVEKWPECYSGGYNPACCRFPKSCSCDVVRNEKAFEVVTEDVVEVTTTVEIVEDEPNDCGEDPFDRIPTFSLNAELDEEGEHKIIEEIKQLFREQFEKLKADLQRNDVDIDVKVAPDINYNEVLAQMSYPCRVDAAGLIIRSTWPITNPEDTKAIIVGYYAQPAKRWSSEFRMSSGSLVSIFVEPREG